MFSQLKRSWDDSKNHNEILGQSGCNNSNAIDIDGDNHSSYRHSHGRSNDHRYDDQHMSIAKLPRDNSGLISVQGKHNGYHHEQGWHNGNSNKYHRCGNRTVCSIAHYQGKSHDYRFGSN